MNLLYLRSQETVLVLNISRHEVGLLVHNSSASDFNFFFFLMYSKLSCV